MTHVLGHASMHLDQVRLLLVCGAVLIVCGCSTAPDHPSNVDPVPVRVSEAEARKAVLAYLDQRAVDVGLYEESPGALSSTWVFEFTRRIGTREVGFDVSVTSFDQRAPSVTLFGFGDADHSRIVEMDSILDLRKDSSPADAGRPMTRQDARLLALRRFNACVGNASEYTLSRAAEQHEWLFFFESRQSRIPGDHFHIAVDSLTGRISFHGGA